MGYLRAGEWEFGYDGWVLRLAMRMAGTAQRCRWLNDKLMRSVVVQGEDGTLRVLC